MAKEWFAGLLGHSVRLGSDEFVSLGGGEGPVVVKRAVKPSRRGILGYSVLVVADRQTDIKEKPRHPRIHTYHTHNLAPTPPM